jgi:alpha-1,3-rhamnosyl/mannosyltransferase
MRILIDATPMLLKSAGVKGYLYEWIQAMRATATGESIETWPAIDPQAPLRHDRSMAAPLRTLAGVGAFLASNRFRFPSYEMLLPPAGVFHACIMQTRLPRRRCVTSTIFDLTPMLMPEHHTSENVRAFEQHARYVLRGAAGLIAISENSRQDALRLLGLDPSRVVTIPCPIHQRYFEVTDDQARDAARQLGLRKPYVLSVGTIEPRKNTGRLLDAWLSLPGGWRQSHELVIAGAPGWRSAAVAARLQQGIEGVRWLRYVPEPLMPGLTRGAAFLAYPSLYEGFGLPPAQSLASARPVLASNVSSLPEVLGPGGVLVDPHSESEIAAGLGRLLESPQRCNEMGEAGRRHALENFNAARVGRLSLDFFRRFAG